MSMDSCDSSRKHPVPLTVVPYIQELFSFDSKAGHIRFTCCSFTDEGVACQPTGEQDLSTELFLATT